jgi:hypothetical protein
LHNTSFSLLSSSLNLFYFIKRFGSHSARLGKIKSNATARNNEIRKGYAPLYITPMGTFVMFFTTKTGIATGGIMDPTQTVIDTIMQAQIGS